MIKIKDKKTKDLWKIYEPGEMLDGAQMNWWTVPLSNLPVETFRSLVEALEFVKIQIINRRDSQKAPKPRGFWD